MAYKLEILPLDEKNKEKRERQIVKNPKGYIVLVHGICHGAWCWENFIDFFATQEYQCYAVSLRGHGESEGKEDINSFRLSDYVDDVKTVVDMCGDSKPFLVGHSMGGAVVQQYIGKYTDTVQGAVLFAPATAPNMFFLKTLGSTLINFRLFFASLVAYGCKKSFIKQKAAFFTGRDEKGKRKQRVKNAKQLPLQKESLRVVFCDLHTKYTRNYDVDIPVFVIGSYADRYFPEKSLKKTANRYAGNDKTALKILERLCHDMMLDDKEWEESAKPVLEFIKEPITFVNSPENHWPRK